MEEKFGRITAHLDTIYPRYDPAEFVGRGWLIEEVTRFLNSPDRRELVIIGEPGSGKSAFVAYLAETWNCPRHFIRVGHVGGVTGVDPRSFLISLGSQLYQKYGRQIFDQAETGRTKVIAGLAKDKAEVVGRAIDQFYTLPFLPVMEREVEVRAGVVVGEARVIGETIKRVVDITLGLDETTLLHAVLINPLLRLAQLYPAERILILIDALDESLEHPGTKIADVIPQVTDADFPTNLRILITSRPGDHLVAFREEDKLYLEDEKHGYRQQSQEDTRLYIAKRLDNPGFAAILKSWSAAEQNRFYTEVIQKSDGNFLYLYHYFNQLEETAAQGETDLRSIAVPGGLDEIYSTFAVGKIRRNISDTVQITFSANIDTDLAERCKKIPGVEQAAISGDNLTVTTQDSDHVMPALLSLANSAGLTLRNLQIQKGSGLGNWEQKYLPLLGVLAVAFEALSRKKLAELAAVELVFVDTIVHHLLQFLDVVRGEQEDLYRLYHRSFGDFLLDPGRNRHYSINADEQHQRIVHHYHGTSATWDEVDWSATDDYGLKHLPDHIYALRHLDEYRPEFHRLICKSFMSAKRIRYGSHREFSINVSTAIALAGDESPPDAVRQMRGALLKAALGVISNNLPADVLESMALMGNARAALDMATLIADAQNRTFAFYQLAKVLLKSGDQENLAYALDQGLSAQLSYIYDLMNRETVTNNAIAERLSDPVLIFDQAGLLKSFFSSYYGFARAGLVNTMANLAENLAKKGKHDTALRLAEAVLGWLDSETDLAGQIDDLTYLAKTYALCGEKEHAIELGERAVSLTDQAGDPTLLIWLAPIFADAGQTDRALQLVDTLSNQDAKDPAYVGIVEALVNSRANDLALTTAQQIKDPEKYFDSLAKVAVGYADESQFNRSTDLLETIEYPVQYTRVITGIIKAMVRSNKLSEAQTVFQRLDALDAMIDKSPRDGFGKLEPIDKAFVSAYLLSEIALGMAKAGEAEQAKPLATQASEFATQIANEQDRPLALSRCVEALAALDMFEPAIQLLPLIADIQEHRTAVEALITSMTSQGKFDSAHELITNLTEAAALASGVQTLAHTLLGANRVDEAIQLTNLVPIPFNRALVMSRLVNDLIDQNHLESARTLLEQAQLTTETLYDKTAFFRLIPQMCALLMEKGKNNEVNDLANWLIEMANREIITAQRAKGYAAAAQVLFILGEIQTAVDAINELGRLTLSEDDKLRAILDITSSIKGSDRAQGVMNMLNSVLPVVAAIPTAREQSAILVEVVQVLSNVSAFDAAIQMTGKISNPLHKTLACCILAEGFARDGLADSSSMMLDYALKSAAGDFSAWNYEGQQIHTISQDIVKQLSSISDVEQQRVEALGQLAITLGSLGRMKDAADAANRAEAIPRIKSWVPTQCKVAIAMVRAGMPDKAENLCKLAEEQLASIEDLAPRALAWIDIAQAWSALNQAEKARICLENSVKMMVNAPFITPGNVADLVSASAPILASWKDGEVLADISRVIHEVGNWWN